MAGLDGDVAKVYNSDVSNRRHSSQPEWRETVLAMGVRLRSLRRQAGLTQTQVAQRLGRTGPGGMCWVSLLERGQLPEMRLADLLATLRACGQRFAAVLDVADPYTSLPTATEEQAWQAVAGAVRDLPDRQRSRALRYDYKLTSRLKTVRSVEQRVRQATGQARAVRWERRLHRTWNDVLNELNLICSSALAAHLLAYGNKVFGTLRRVRKVRPVWRDKAMAKLDSWPAKHGLEPEPFIKMKQAVIALFADMERKGELD